MNKRKIGVVLLALLLAGMAMVPLVSAAEQYSYEQLKKWQDAHTIPVVETVNQRYADGILTIETVYTGKELTKRFGISAFTRKNVMKLSAEDAAKLNLKMDKTVTSEREILGVFTAANDPPRSAASGYPVWLYSYSNGVYYQTGDPINMIWAGASLSTIKAEILEKGWYDGIWEVVLYINDGGNWKIARGIATSTTGVFGRDYLRLCQLYTDQVIGAVHSDSPSCSSIRDHGRPCLDLLPRC